MNRLFEIVGHLRTILRKKHLTSTQRSSLFFSYIRISFIRFWVGRLPAYEVNSLSFLGCTITFDSFSDVFWTFCEVFLDEDYYFETENKEPVIIDCGANIGISLLYFKWLYKDSTITAFEIEPSNLEFLKSNIKNNNLTGITLIEKAVGREKGSAVLRGNRRAGSISKALIDEQSKKDSSYAEFEYTVEIVPLSNYVEGKIDFLKMDIEGVEADVYLELDESGKFSSIEKTTLEYHKFSKDENKLSTIITIFEKNDLEIIFPNNYNKLSEIKRSYYNFMIRAGKGKH